MKPKTFVVLGTGAVVAGLAAAALVWRRRRRARRPSARVFAHFLPKFENVGEAQGEGF